MGSRLPDPAVPPSRHPSWHGWAALALGLAFLGCIVGFVTVFVLDARETVVAAAARRPPDKGWLDWANYVLGGVFVCLLAAMMAIDQLQKPAEYAHAAERIAGGAPFVLYLRPFAIERRLIGYLPMIGGLPYVWAIPLMRYLFGLEAYLKRAIEPAGLELIAIGEVDGTAGIAKIKPTDDEWQDLFIDHALRSRCIVVVPFTSAGSVWELDWIVENALAKTILVLPSVEQDPFIGLVKTHALPQQWQAICARYSSRLALPDYPLDGRLLTFRPERRAVGDTRWVADQTLEFGRADFDTALARMLRSRSADSAGAPGAR